MLHTRKLSREMAMNFLQPYWQRNTGEKSILQFLFLPHHLSCGPKMWAFKILQAFLQHLRCTCGYIFEYYAIISSNMTDLLEKSKTFYLHGKPFSEDPTFFLPLIFSTKSHSSYLEDDLP